MPMASRAVPTGSAIARAVSSGLLNTLTGNSITFSMFLVWSTPNWMPRFSISCSILSHLSRIVRIATSNDASITSPINFMRSGISLNLPSMAFASETTSFSRGKIISPMPRPMVLILSTSVDNWPSNVADMSTIIPAKSPPSDVIALSAFSRWLKFTWPFSTASRTLPNSFASCAVTLIPRPCNWLMSSINRRP